MPYEVRKEGNRYVLVLSDESPNVHALPMAPQALENYLHQETWFILVFAIWSGPDRDAIGTILSLGKEPSLPFKIGIRPFDEFNELQKWCPDASPTSSSPIWLLLQNGNLVAQRVGVQSQAELWTWLKMLI